MNDLTGMTFGRLTVVKRSGTSKRGDIVWACICKCGAETAVRGSNLRNGNTKSCGCFQRERASESTSTHRLTKSPEYRSWASMIARCENPKYHHFHRYGGRGIRICERWRNSFELFLSDMGPRPSLKHSLDRKDNDGNYEPGNCRWATAKEQRLNRSNMTTFKRITP